MILGRLQKSRDSTNRATSIYSITLKIFFTKLASFAIFALHCCSQPGLENQHDIDAPTTPSPPPPYLRVLAAGAPLGSTSITSTTCAPPPVWPPGTLPPSGTCPVASSPALAPSKLLDPEDSLSSTHSCGEKQIGESRRVWTTACVYNDVGCSRLAILTARTRPRG
jgi:hypothetical protein